MYARRTEFALGLAPSQGLDVAGEAGARQATSMRAKPMAAS